MARVLVFGSLAESLITFRGPLLKKMAESGHQVFACAPNLSKEVKNALSEMSVAYNNVELNRAGVNPLHDTRTVLQLVDSFKKINPDIFLGYTIKPVIYGSLASRIIGVPSIYSMITGLGYAFSNSGIKSVVTGVVAKRLYSFALSFNKKVFFQNPDDMCLFTSKGILAKNKSILINGSGVSLDSFQPSPFPQTLSFLLIARLIKDKGVYEYVKAAQIVKKKHPHIKFRLVGFIDSNPSSITEEELRTWVASGVIEYLGRLQDVRPAIMNSSVYVLPSYREGTPRSVLEAMAMGRPIITTDAPGCRETVLDGKNGFLVPVKDVGSLVTAMMHFAKHHKDIVSMGSASRKIAVNKYDVNKVNAVILDTMELV